MFPLFGFKQHGSDCGLSSIVDTICAKNGGLALALWSNPFCIGLLYAVTEILPNNTFLQMHAFETIVNEVMVSIHIQDYTFCVCVCVCVCASTQKQNICET